MWSSDVTGSCITGYGVTENDVTGTGSREPETGNEREIISPRFSPVFPAFFLSISRGFSGTPLDSRYEQWNCESNLYWVTIDLC